ncbi:MAG: hypothetical protein U9N36_01190 [Euryarchaeota archaeon]|nr:hypothetical protein [Euryarchaeota archaeon]
MSRVSDTILADRTQRRLVTGFVLVYERLHAIGMSGCAAGRNVENAAQKHLFGQVIWMKIGILLIGTCAIVHTLIGMTATWYVDDDRGAGYGGSREARA